MKPPDIEDALMRIVEQQLRLLGEDPERQGSSNARARGARPCSS